MQDSVQSKAQDRTGVVDNDAKIRVINYPQSGRVQVEVFCFDDTIMKALATIALATAQELEALQKGQRPPIPVAVMDKIAPPAKPAVKPVAKPAVHAPRHPRRQKANDEMAAEAMAQTQMQEQRRRQTAKMAVVRARCRFGVQARKARKAERMSQVELAEMLSLRPYEVSKVEMGRADLDTAPVVLIADIFGLEALRREFLRQIS